MSEVLFLQPPSPPRMVVTRDYAGGFGVAIQSPREEYGHWRWSIPYVSLMYSAGLLASQGYDIAYVDAQAERLDASAVLARVGRFNPSIIVAVVSLPSLKGDGYLLRKLRNECPDAKLICIGTVCKVLPSEIAKMDFADVLVLGEAESVLPDLMKRELDNADIDKVKNIGIVDGGRLHRTRESTELVDLDSLPWPPYDVMPTTLYRDPYFGEHARFIPVWASRGCPMPCSFYCPYPLGFGSRMRFRSCDDVGNEIGHLHREFGVTGFILRDQIFTLKRNRAESICDLLIEQKLRIRWMCETRFDMVDEKLLKKMRRAGCREIHFGLETGDPELLRKVGKPGLELATVKETIKLTRKVGIKPMTHIILGLPGETPQTIQRTLSTLRETGITRANVNLATPYPGTALYEYALRNGLLETQDWTKYTSYNKVMGTESMSSAELGEWASYLYRNLLGESTKERIVYLLKSRDIIDYISNVSSKIVQNPSIPFHFLRTLISTQDLTDTIKTLKTAYNHDL